MVTLAVDTSHAVGSAALAVDGGLLGVERFDQPSSHLVALGRAVETLLTSANRTARDIDRVAIVIGPGSFTGLRIGLAFAKGLHAARAMDVVTVDSLRLLSLAHLQTSATVCAMIDARRGEVYGAVYARASDAESHDDPVAAREVVAPRAEALETFLAALAPTTPVFVGTGAAAHAEAIRSRFPAAQVGNEGDMFPSTGYLATLAHRMRALEPEAIRALEPLYIRPSGAERKRLRPRAPGAADNTRPQES